MRLKHVMTTPVWSIAPDVDASVAWEQMQRSRIRHLVVVEGERIVGILSQRDLGGTHGPAVCQGKCVSELMNSNVLVASPETSLSRAAQMMRGEMIGCLPIVEGKELVGIVTTSDLLDIIAQRTPRRRIVHRQPVHLARRVQT